VWLVRTGRRAAAWMVGVPMVFMLVMTTWSLVILISRFVSAGRWSDPAGWVAVLLGVLAIALVVEATRALRAGAPPAAPTAPTAPAAAA
jgi:carbon starvation protein